MILFVSIDAVSAIFTLAFILPFNALELSTKDLFIIVESDRSLVVIAVESVLIFVARVKESS